MFLRPLLLAGCFVLPLTLGALAQAEAERQLDDAIGRLRTAPGSHPFQPGGAGYGIGAAAAPFHRTFRPQRGADRLTAAEVTLERLRADGVGRAVLSDLRMEGAKQGNAPGPMVVTAGRVTLGELVLPLLPGGPGVKSAPGGTAGGVDWAAASVGEALAEGMRMDSAGQGDAELGRLSLSGYAPGALREAVLEGFRFTDRRDGETRLRLGRARLSGAVLPRIGQPLDPWALAAESALLEGAEVASAKEGVTIRLGRTQLDAWGTGKNSTLAMEALRVEGSTAESGPFVAELGRAGMAGIGLRDLVYALAHDINPPDVPPGQEQSAEIEGLSLSGGGAPLLQIGAIRARNAWDAAAPTVGVGTLGVEGIALDLPPEYGGAWLDGLGIKRVLAQMAVTTRLSRAEGWLLTDPFTFQAQGLGNLGLSIDLRGIKVPVAGQPSPSKDDPFSLVAGWSIAGFTLRYTDDGLLRALIAQQAAQERVPERQLRERYAQMALRAPVPGAAPGKESPALLSIRQAWAGFARDLGTIEIVIRPPKPVPVLDTLALSATPPDQLVRQLNITASARPPSR